MKRFTKIILTLGVMVGASLALSPATVGAVNVFEPCTTTGSDSSVCAATSTDSASSLIKTIVNVLLFILGAISVIMIIIGGISYATSAGDSTAVTRGKNTILYSVVGLVVAFSAYAIVNWVVFAANPNSAQNKCNAQSGMTYDTATKTCKKK